MSPGQIKFFRLAQGIRQYELAEALGVSQARISALENGKPPTPEELARLRFVLSIPAQEADHAA